ncbi:hypothetical protein ACIGT4_24175 [Streptomyces sioyaensis]|uniref:hypothetical protein n=1 Tax=Streptomyces sioyaensis TaxID=67364 RepID=UPI0037CFAA73
MDQRRAIVATFHRRVDVPGTLGELIAQMMHRDPADRPTSAEVRAALGGSLQRSADVRLHPRGGRR